MFTVHLGYRLQFSKQQRRLYTEHWLKLLFVMLMLLGLHCMCGHAIADTDKYSSLLHRQMSFPPLFSQHLELANMRLALQ